MMYSACFAVSTPVPRQSPLRSSPFMSRCSRVRPPCAAQVSSHPAAANLILNALSSDETASVDEGKRSRLTHLRKQIEFWFSSANLKRDWYLRRQMNDEGWLDPSVFLKFNLIKKLNVDLSDIVAACGESDLLEVSTPSNSFGDQLQQTRVRRAGGPLQVSEEEEDDEGARSIVAENIPQDSTCDSIKEIFSRYGEITYVWVPKKSRDTLRGYALISFQSPGVAARAISDFRSDQQQGTVPENVVVKSKTDWEVSFKSRKMDSKVLYVENIPSPCDWRVLWDAISRRCTEEGIPLLYLSYRNDDSHCFLTLRNQADADKALESIFSRLEVGSNRLSASVLSDPEMLSKYWASAAEKMSQRKQRSPEKSPESESETSFPPGVIVKIDGLPDGLHWKYVFDALKNWGDIVFLRYSSKTGDCYVRFSAAETASSAASGITGNYMCEYKVTAEVLTGQEEEAYWANFREARKRRERKPQYARVSTYGDQPSVSETQEKTVDSPEYAAGSGAAKQLEGLREGDSGVSEEGTTSKVAGVESPLEEKSSDELEDTNFREVSLPDAAQQLEALGEGESEVAEEDVTSKAASVEIPLEEKSSDELKDTNLSDVTLSGAAKQLETLAEGESEVSEEETVSKVEGLDTASEEQSSEEPAADAARQLETLGGDESEVSEEDAASEVASVEASLEQKPSDELQKANLGLDVGGKASLRSDEEQPTSGMSSDSTALRESAKVLFVQETGEEQESTNGLSNLGRAESSSASADQEPAATSGSHL